MSLWLRLSRGDVAAALVILALAGGTAWFYWIALPDPAQPPVMAGATVVSLQYSVPGGRSGGQASVSVKLRLDDGTEISVGRKMRCLPAVHQGDRVRVIGSRRHAGGRIWSIAGEPCPGDQS